MHYMSKNKINDLASAGLRSGDQFSREEFHAIYENMPEDFFAELIDGTVFVRQSLARNHGLKHLRLGSLLDRYQAATPGIEAADNASVFLSEIDEVQPDLLLRILPEYRGVSKNTYDNYIDGPPELVVEVAHSSRAIDLHKKRERYLKFGVKEYIVYCVKPEEIYWFDFSKRTNKAVGPDPDGIYRSIAFPGLWIDEPALFSMDFDRSMKVLEAGLQSPEHTTFVVQLRSCKL